MRVFDCEKLTNILTETAEKASILRNNLKSVGETPEDLIVLQQEIEVIIESAVDWFGRDQIGIRNEIAKEKGYPYIGKFNKYGLAKANLDTSILPYSALIDRAGEVVFPADGALVRISDFTEGLASVEAVDGRYYLKENGERLNDKLYGTTLPYRYGQALVKYKSDPVRPDIYHKVDLKGDKVGEINLDIYGGATYFEGSGSGYLQLHQSGAGVWFITPSGERIPSDPNKYFEDGPGDLNAGIARVCDRLGVGQNGRVSDSNRQVWYYINQNGERLNDGILAQELRAVTDFYKGRAYVQTIAGTIILTDTRGNLIKEIGTNEELGKLDPRSFSDGLLVTSRRTDQALQTKIFDLSGSCILEIDGTVEPFSDGVAFASTGDKRYIIDRELHFTEIVEPFNWDALKRFKEGVCELKINDPVKKDKSGFPIKHKFYIDKKGRRVFG